MTFYLILIGIGILAISIPIIISLIKKKKEDKKPKPVVSKPEMTKQDEGHPQVEVKSKDTQLYKSFIEEYGDKDLKFPELQYRKGAPITCEFGIAAGFKYIRGRMVWGYVRLHTGVDRARGGSETFSWSDNPVDDIVKSPFNFDKSNYIHYGEKKGYGTLVQLFNFKYGFEMRIAHLDPRKDFIDWTFGEIKAGNKIGRNWVIGSAGTYGASSGAHTHTEFKSIDDKCEPFEILLEEKFGSKVKKEFTPTEIVRLYRKHEHFKEADEDTILDDWQELKKNRGAIFANKYLYRYVDWDGKTRTRYSSELLFNGL